MLLNGPRLLKSVLLSALFILCVSLILAWKFNLNSGMSFLLGGGISIIPALLFGKIFFQTTGARAAKKVLNAFYIAEAIKLLLMGILFVLTFQWQGLQAAFLFLGFIFAQLVNILIMLQSS